LEILKEIFNRFRSKPHRRSSFRLSKIRNSAFPVSPVSHPASSGTHQGGHIPCLADVSSRRGHSTFQLSISRRHLLRYFLGFSLFSFFPLRVRELWAASSDPSKKEKDSIGQYFNGEELFYDAGFWVFKRVATGKISFKKLEEKGRYMAVLQGETLGVLGWVAHYRVDTYRSIVEEVEEGRRLRSVSFEEDVKIGDKRKKRTHFFDYQKRMWIQVAQRYDRPIVREEEEIPPGMVYDDFITGFYNFRYGAYGEIERGRKYTVSTFPKKGPSHYEVWIAPEEEEEKNRKSLKVKEGKEYLIRLFIGPDITRSKDGMIEGWLSKDFIPIEGRIRNVILLGDAKATLVKEVKPERKDTKIE
jgi:Protein of unknown function (DUF3108)